MKGNFESILLAALLSAPVAGSVSPVFALDLKASIPTGPVAITTPVPSKADLASPSPRIGASSSSTAAETSSFTTDSGVAVAPGTIESVVTPSAAADAAAPAAIAPPGGQTLSLALVARGVQIYQCTPLPGDKTKYEWALKGPEAHLIDNTGKVIGSHSAGPAWSIGPEDRLVGKVEAKMASPDGKGVPWLLLSADRAVGPTLGKIKSIQRINTVGGLPPVEPADADHAGQIRRQKYSAIYRFYSSK